jgi:methyl-accepting chemotaxis protein
MNFFKNRSLKRIGLYLMAGMFLIFLAEYAIIRYKIEVLEEVEEKKDFARSAQLEGQQIALLVQHYTDGQTHLAADIAARLEQENHLLQILREGGRMDGTNVFLKPLSRLPRITFNELDQSWRKYQANVLSLVLADTSQPVASDSSGTVLNSAQSHAMLPAQWITLSNWYKKLEIDLTDEADMKKNAVENWVLAFIFFDLVLLSGLFYLFNRYVLRPIGQLEKNTIQLKQDFDVQPNELGKLKHQVNEILEQLKDATDFVGAIGEGKLDFDYKTLDKNYAQDKNQLADSLISMQGKLKAMSVDEQRRQWANEGLTKFVEILRSSNDNINVLGDKIISALVQYTGSNQGGLYLLNDDDEHQKHLELIALFAYNSKKFEKQKVRLGEGILGQTFLEKQTTLLTEIPDEYIRITSGLGDATPRALVIVPLKVDKDVYGIVELASFKSYQPHEIAFVERLAETIASTLASVKGAQKNRQLIEQFQEQTEEMRAQEEEMRQNMEELQATQEELSRKEKDYVARIQELESRPDHKAELEKLRQDQQVKEQNYLQQIRDLQHKLSQKPAPAGDWALADEVEKNLKFQLQALQIAQEEFPAK